MKIYIYGWSVNIAYAPKKNKIILSRNESAENWKKTKKLFLPNFAEMVPTVTSNSALAALQALIYFWDAFLFTMAIKSGYLS